MDADVLDAIMELAGYYGMASGDEFIKEIYNGGNFKSTSDALAAAKKSRTESVVSNFTSDSKSFKTVKDINADIVKLGSAKFKEVAQELAICQDNPQYGIGPESYVCGVHGDQGKGKKDGQGQFYTVNCLRAKDEKVSSSNKPTPVNVIQVFKAAAAPPTVNTELVALWLNSIPALEMSRAVPFLDIRLMPDVPSGFKGPKPLSLDRFLLGESGYDNGTQDLKNLVDSKFLADPTQGQRADVDVSGQKKSERVASAMEVFTSPQTMVGASPHPNSDKFRPFMSFNDMTITVQPGGGMMSFKTAKMSLVLHDRTRLREVLALVAPGQMGKTQIEVTYGWSHPQNNQFSRKADANATNNRFAKLINAMRVTEVYNVTTSEYSFNDSGEVELDINLALAGANTFANKEITDSKVGEREKELDKAFKEISSILTRIRSNAPNGKISFPKYVTAATNLGGSALTMRKNIYKMRQTIQSYKGNKEPDFKALGKALEEVFGKSSGKGQLNALTKSKGKVLDEMIATIKKTPDPFLPHRAIGNVTKGDMKVVTKGQLKSSSQAYVSFGKLISAFVADALKTDNDYSEIQVIFYPINESASYANTLNLAQFPIAISDFEKIIKERFGVTNRLTIGSFLRVINGYFLRDQGSEAYGMNALFGNRVKGDNKKQTTKRKRANSYKKTDKYTAKKLAILRDAYGLDEDSSGLNFRMPQVTIKYEVRPVNSADGSNTAKPIMRMHVMDQACGKAEQLKDAMMAFGGDGVFSKISRKSASKLDAKVRHPHHGSNIDKQLERLTELGVVQKALELDEIKKLDPAKKDQLKDVYVVKAKVLPSAAGPNQEQITSPMSLAFNAKGVFKQMVPSVTYGAANGNIITANLQTISDSQMNTVMMLSQNSSDDDKADVGSDNGLPLQIMPTQLSIETTGCPYFAFSQQLFVDFGTNTTADNFYAVVGIDHKIASGEFNTEVNMVQLDGFGAFRSALDAKRRTDVLLKLAESAKKSSK